MRDLLRVRPEVQRRASSTPAAARTRPRDQKNFGALRAIDPVTGERKWEFRYPTPSASGVLTTASGLVFAGDGDGNLMAFDSRTGKNLWHYQMGVAMRVDVAGRPTCSTAASTCWCRRAAR